MNETGMVDVPGRVERPPAPGAESAGPALVDLVRELREVTRLGQAYFARARLAAAEQLYAGMVQDATDANGDAALKLFEVPQGSTGYLTLATVDEAGFTPASPDTSANLWHAIYAGPPGDATPAQIALVGNMFDCLPQNPTVDAQIPFNYCYGTKEAAPALVGPGSFWFVIDAATATRQVAVRYNVLVCRTEP